MSFTIGAPLPVSTSTANGVSTDLLFLVARMSRAAIIVDATGRPLYANDAAQRVLAGHLSHVSSDPGGGWHVSRLLDDLLRSCLPTSDATTVPLALPRLDRQPLIFKGVPIGPIGPMGSARQGAAAAVVLVTDPGTSDEADRLEPLRLLGLTRAEAQVASLIGSGLSPREASQLIGNAESTVRVQLQRIYQKLSIGRQNELAAVVWRLGLISL